MLDACPVSARALPAVRHAAALTECHLARGDLARAVADGERVRAFTSYDGVPGALAAYTLGEIASAQGNADLASLRYAEASEHLGDDLDDPDLVPWRSGEALALTRLHRPREADRLARQHLALSRDGGTAYTVAHALRTAATTNADGARLVMLREAQAILKDLEARRLAAQVDTDLAVLLTLEGSPAGRPRPSPCSAARRPTPAARTCSRSRAGSGASSSGSARNPAASSARRWPASPSPSRRPPGWRPRA